MIRKLCDQAVELRPGMRGGTGTVSVQSLFAPDEFGASVRLCARLTLPAGASIGNHAHEGEDRSTSSHADRASDRWRYRNHRRPAMPS